MNKKMSYLLTLGGLASVGLAMVLLKTVAEPQAMMKTLPYILLGLGCGAFGQGLGGFFNRRALEKDPQLARQMEIQSKDERNIMIGNMAKAKGYTVMTYVYSALLLAYALMGVDWTVLIPLVIAYLFVQGYAVYCRFKIEKEL